MRKSLGVITVNLLLGLVLGAIVSQLLGLFLQEGSILHDALVKGLHLGPTLVTIDLAAVKFTVGVECRFTVLSLVGLFVVAHIMRWYR